MVSAGTDETERPSIATAGRRTTSGSRLVEWVKVDGDRLLLTFGASVATFALFLGLHHVGAFSFASDDSVTRMASGMIAGTFSLVTLVVSVNQLILSQEFSPPGEQRNQFGGVLEFRRDIEDVADVTTAPVEPTRMLGVLAEAIGHRARALADAVANDGDEEYRSRVVEFADRVEESTEWVDETLERRGVEPFDALSVAVEYDDALQLSAARHLRNDTPELSDETATALDELIGALRTFGTAQAQFKTVYLQRELSRFSQLTIYFGVPAMLAAISIALMYGDVGGATVSATYLPYVTSFLATVVLVPLILLGTYILRTATLTRRTAATGPMFFGDAPDDGPVGGRVGESSRDESQP